MTPSLGLGRRAASEALGTALLLVAVVGSGIMAERLAGGNVALALLANAIATGGAIFALILVFAPWSGAHFNPVVTLALALDGAMGWRAVLAYVAAQSGGAIAGVWIAHVMFELPVLEWSAHARTGLGQWVGELVATFGLLLVIESGRRSFASRLPAAIAAYITAAYWFTSSTSFANPAVTLARSLTDSFAGIAPNNVAGFVLCQCLGAAAAVGFVRWVERRPGRAVTLTVQTSPAIKAIDS
ncbi:MAG TPA: MIP/aquaporin family protein [Stellaceae bacterium]|nr:MIP/aquaporin family protein [Stellaceae bacterium]